MGGRIRKRREFEFGPAFRLATKIQAKHRLAYVEPELPVIAIEPADRSYRIEVPLDAHELHWAPVGGMLFSVGEQIHKIDPDTGHATQLTELGPNRTPQSLSCSPDGRELAFTIETIYRPHRWDANNKFRPGLSEQCLAHMKLEDATLTEEHHHPLLYPSVCWMTRLAALQYAEGRRTCIAELDTGKLVQVTNLIFGQRLPGLCTSSRCQWHRRMLRPEEIARLAPDAKLPFLPLVVLSGTAIAVILGGTELRLAERSNLDQGELVVRTRGGGSTYGDHEYDYIRWSPDRRLLFARLAGSSDWGGRKSQQLLLDRSTGDIVLDDRDNVHFEPTGFEEWVANR